MTIDCTGMSNGELFATYRAVLAELRARELVRTENAPAGDYAEHLVQRALGGALATSSTAGHDLTTPAGVRVQVKCRIDDPSGRNPRTKLHFSSLEGDVVVIVLFHADYSVRRAIRLPASTIAKLATRDRRGFHLHIRPSLLDHPTAIDLTRQLAAAATAPGSLEKRQPQE